MDNEHQKEARERMLKVVHRADYADLILQVHYARRWPSVTYAFGLFVAGALEGVCTFGTPASAPLRSGLAGAQYVDKVLELNRLVLRNNYPNDASWLVSASLRALKQRGHFIVISFADTEQNHAGVVYQACGFSYRGLSAKRTDWKIRGQEHLHGQTIADRYRGVENRAAAIRADFGDDFYLSPRPRKHRYVRVVGNRPFLRDATAALRYREEPYP
jgi:hypothetical protein